jgi:hypothetical protein
MSVSARILLLILCGAVIFIAFGRTLNQTHDEELQAAINIARTTRFAPRNDARVDVWLTQHQPGAILRWRGASRGVLDSKVPLILEFIQGDKAEQFSFDVVINSRSLVPNGPAAQELVSTIRQWATSR